MNKLAESLRSTVPDQGSVDTYKANAMAFDESTHTLPSYLGANVTFGCGSLEIDTENDAAGSGSSNSNSSPASVADNSLNRKVMTSSTNESEVSNGDTAGGKLRSPRTRPRRTKSSPVGLGEDQSNGKRISEGDNVGSDETLQRHKSEGSLVVNSIAGQHNEISNGKGHPYSSPSETRGGNDIPTRDLAPESPEERTNTGGAGSSDKGVTFAPSPPRDSSASTKVEFPVSKADREKSLPELLQTISKLRDKVSQAQIDHSAEKALRKKKEKNLIKLAKQLNSRSEEMKEKDKQLEQLLANQASVETRYEQARRDLDSLTLKHKDDARSHHEEITSYQTRLRDTRREMEERVLELNESHCATAEELRREILLAKLEADRLRVQLAKMEMSAVTSSDEKATERIMQRTVQESLYSGKRRQRIRVDRSCRGIFIALATVVVLAVSYVSLLWSGHLSASYANLNVLCSPAMPGTKFDRSTSHSSHEAPWWVPRQYKIWTFGLLCNRCSASNLSSSDCPAGKSRVRTRLQWSSRNNMLVVSSLDIQGERDDVRVHEKIWKKMKRVSDAYMSEDGRVILQRRNGKSEVFDGPWIVA